VRENGEDRRDRRLKSWKEIAAFFGTNERTAKRWEASRGLPVHRLPGGARATVYADAGELEAWLMATQTSARPRPGRAEGPMNAPPAAPARPPLALKPMAGAGLALALVAATVLAYRVEPRGTAAAEGEMPPTRQPPQEAVELFLAGTYQWEKRTPDSLGRAVRYFNAAIARDPQYAEAHVGLANCYLLLREYTTMPAEEAYRQAEQAARRALELDGRLASAHAALAFATFHWRHDFDSARRSFARAIALDPGSARAHHWYATALMHLGEFGPALDEIGTAQRLEPQSRAILADKALILFFSGRAEEAIRLLRQMESDEPDFLSPPAYLAMIGLARGDHAGYLRHARLAARLQGDAGQSEALDAAARGLAAGGPDGMVAAMIEAQRRLLAAGGDGAYRLAQLHALAGDRAAAVAALRQAVERREQYVLGVRIDPLLKSLHGDPGFRRLAESVGLPVAPATGT
jgi:tetratricopeptide (TPR) repeat protein